MQVLVGLGNPGAKYVKTRHNIGFRAMDAIHAAHGFGPWREKFQGRVAEGVITTAHGPRKTLVLQPQTYMNESGRSVGELMRFYKLDLDALTVFHDEIDLAPGKFRLKTGGGSAGNNGIKSITAALGPDYRRARMGVGHPGAREKVHGWVLSDFYKADEIWVADLCDAVARSVDLLVSGDVDAFQTRVTHLAPAPKPAASPASNDDAASTG